jgi:hypothetical protein
MNDNKIKIIFLTGVEAVGILGKLVTIYVRIFLFLTHISKHKV